MAVASAQNGVKSSEATPIDQRGRFTPVQVRNWDSLRQSLCHAAARSLPRLVPARLRRRLAPPTIVLLYHRILPDAGRDPNHLVTSAAHFDAQLAWLARHCRPLTQEQFIEQLHHPFTTGLALGDARPQVLITFDDGYADTLRHALPLLIKHRMSATVFVPTGLVGSSEPFWWDALEQIVFDGRLPPAGWRLPDGTTISPHCNRAATYRLLHQRLRPLGDRQRRAALAELIHQTGLVPSATDDSRPMSWDELRLWRLAGMAVGGHARTHPQLSSLPTPQLQAEIADCQRDFQHHLGTAMESFAYPYGTPSDFDPRCEAAVRGAGFRCGLANRVGNARWARSVYAVPRCLVRDWPPEEFAARFLRWCKPLSG